MRIAPVVLLALAASLALPACRPAFDAPGAWTSHKGKVPFVVGWEKGLAAATASGKPLAIFLTADW